MKNGVDLTANSRQKPTIETFRWGFSSRPSYSGLKQSGSIKNIKHLPASTAASTEAPPMYTIPQGCSAAWAELLRDSCDMGSVLRKGERGCCMYARWVNSDNFHLLNHPPEKEAGLARSVHCNSLISFCSTRRQGPSKNSNGLEEVYLFVHRPRKVRNTTRTAKTAKHTIQTKFATKFSRTFIEGLLGTRV